MITFNEDFNISWLKEMPMGILPLSNNLFNSIVNNMKEFVKAGLESRDIGNGFFTLQGTQVAFYWHETNNIIDIIVELSIRPQSLVVNQIAKNPNSNVKVYATDLYDIIVKSNNKSLVLMSDEYLTQQGLNVWVRLLNIGHTISVYDRDDTSKGLIPIKSQRELEQFFKDKDPNYKRYQFVLSESNIKLVETTSFFNTKRLRTLSGYPN